MTWTLPEPMLAAPVSDPALRYPGTDARHLGEVLRVRTLSRLGVDVRVGIGPTITVAATASAQIATPGGVLAIGPDRVAAWLGRDLLR
ncbi:hypothetical protein [Streptomyces sp. NPDC016172]|uniref:hypothetical protein n=1 Tax=Streptomyces sp. NPDC016172 TaxID=3364964 RepID=UPI0037028B9D